ncbi:MAG: 30S ribosomal protein S6 [Omnitrophica WOR_2 bacterium RIFCSPHIGHO2_02_FULL_67_20]|nr:MAG: 30S ribosomal protein S6 [Omnitrophica WOR_2 bacterium RIFCSPHIGHO2_02_FULL_67_20]
MPDGATRPYEALVIFRAGGTEQDMARHAAQLEGPIKKLGGRIETTQSLGRRKLAFRIAKQTEGHYHLLRFQAPTEQIRELERLFRLDEAVVRFVILSADEIAPFAGVSLSLRPAGARAGAGRN